MNKGSLNGGRRRKDDLDAFHVPDDPFFISQALGGSPFFFEVGALGLHRVGLFGGLGWREGNTLFRVRKISAGFRVERCNLAPDRLTYEIQEHADAENMAGIRPAYEKVAHG